MFTAATKVLVTTSTYGRWRGDTLYSFVHELSHRLGRYHSVYVLSPHARGASGRETIDGINVTRYRYFPERYETLNERSILPNLKKNPLLWLQVPLFMIAQLLAIRRIVRQYHIDIIHAHWLIPQGFIAVVYKILFNRNIKILATAHGSDVYGLRWWPFGIIKKWIISNVDFVTAVSSALHDDVLALAPGKNIPTDVIPMGVDFTLFSPSCVDEEIRRRYGITGPFILYVGRLSAKKGVDLVLKAMPIVLRDFPDAMLLVVGDGEDREALEGLARTLGLHDTRVIFTGALPHEKLPPYYATADLFVAPSASEGFGLAFAEAIASGTPAVGTNLPSLREILDERETGFVVKENSSEAIAEKLISVLQIKEDLKTAAVKAREELRARCDFDIISQRYRRLIEELSGK